MNAKPRRLGIGELKAGARKSNKSGKATGSDEAWSAALLLVNGNGNVTKRDGDGAGSATAWRGLHDMHALAAALPCRHLRPSCHDNLNKARETGGGV